MSAAGRAAARPQIFVDPDPGCPLSARPFLSSNAGAESAIDRAGEAFDDPAARRALLDAVRQTCGPVELVDLDLHINDDAFAEAAARELIRLMQAARSG